MAPIWRFMWSSRLSPCLYRANLGVLRAADVENQDQRLPRGFRRAGASHEKLVLPSRGGAASELEQSLQEKYCRGLSLCQHHGPIFPKQHTNMYIYVCMSYVWRTYGASQPRCRRPGRARSALVPSYVSRQFCVPAGRGAPSLA